MSTLQMVRPRTGEVGGYVRPPAGTELSWNWNLEDSGVCGGMGPILKYTCSVTCRTRPCGER